ncbi:hypothetical protein EK21DRAFT_78158 [Setomelanomma holmii]|uniref:PEBP-like protein n=1 Tax=Setomelanomma holmii TaxID=210430 RepID=A0A9P4LHL9_9PLEO|nr:hypothetical protein EK21DRAFT_78158 [Setomelanomma holmii]
MENAPNLSTPSWSSSGGSGLLIMLDLDTPYDNTRVSSLHWLVTDVTLANNVVSPTAQNPGQLNKPSSRVSYQMPEPPIGDVAHTYAFYLFAPTPASFTIPSSYSKLADSRTPFNLTRFLADCGLDQQSVVARNDFRVRNLAGTPTGSFPPPRASKTVLALSSAAAPSQTGAVSQGVSTNLGVVGQGILGSMAAVLTVFSAFIIV